MVSNQPPPFPAFVGANPETVDDDPSDQLIADPAEQEAVASGASSSTLDEAFANLTPDHGDQQE